MSNIRTSHQGSQTIIPPGRGNVAKRPTVNREQHRPPRNRGFTNAPAQEVLDGLIRRAIEALKNGIYWDRGSIINIIV